MWGNYEEPGSRFSALDRLLVISRFNMRPRLSNTPQTALLKTVGVPATGSWHTIKPQRSNPIRPRLKSSSQGPSVRLGETRDL